MNGDGRDPSAQKAAAVGCDSDASARRFDYPDEKSHQEQHAGVADRPSAGWRAARQGWPSASSSYRAATPMNIALIAAGPEQAPVFAHLMQLYYHDLSELLGIEIGDDGRFGFAHHESYWSDPRYHPSLLRVDGHLAGFAVVDAQSRLTNEPVWDMSQFFVLRRHRGAGVGARAAVATLDAFRGRWEVREVARNTPAQAFWRKVIGRYTDHAGGFREVMHDDDRWRGPVQLFDNTLRENAGGG